MEFEFIRNTLMGEYYIKSSMGHEIVGRWLQEEIGKDRQKIAQVDALLESAQRSPSEEHTLVGREISVAILENEVVVQENILTHGQAIPEESEFDFYDSESTACCGLKDLQHLLEQWQVFLTSR
ncbi:YacL family protein [Vibrio ostreicida]|uniref:UPF0231 protein QWZ16_05000 n=1 Tax=Vibrio ostreicida TaxID=526588 RepID=A0ABT8BSH7_9VIBR|nr:YacL family protein [Vibrio ostreicida]MDN3609082.1 YacL family protein [Vibrio ostreicida]NPD07977.1 YacL family protein [Vibrio ostreicida]